MFRGLRGQGVGHLKSTGELARKKSTSGSEMRKHNMTV